MNDTSGFYCAVALGQATGHCAHSLNLTICRLGFYRFPRELRHSNATYIPRSLSEWLIGVLAALKTCRYATLRHVTNKDEIARWGNMSL